jgi:hypothetical protein
MKAMVIFLLILTGGPATVQSLDNSNFLVGLYADEARSIACVTGGPGTVFEQVAWVYVPNELGLAYVTFRFDFPENLDRTRRPVFNELVSHTIFTDFPDGTVEWNMLFDDCPSGWIQVFSQECVLLDSQLSWIEIVGALSLARDCDFILNGVHAISDLSLNDPECPQVSAVAMTWSSMKTMYR